MLNITKYKDFCNKYLSKLLLQIRKLIEMNRKFSFLLSFHFYFVNWSSGISALDFSHFLFFIWLRKLHADSIVVSSVGFIFLWQVQRSKLACTYVFNIPVSLFATIVFLGLFIKIFRVILFYNYYKYNQNISLYNLQYL